MMFPRRSGPLSEYQPEFSAEELYFFCRRGRLFLWDRLKSRVRRVYSAFIICVIVAGPHG